MASSDEGRKAQIVGGVLMAQNELHARAEEQVARQKDRYRSATKTRKSADTRRRIMDAATQLMVERGNTAFQMSEISNRCGMSKGALYYYFADKGDLVEAIHESLLDDLVEGIDAAVDDAQTPEEALYAVSSEFARRAGGGGPLPMAIVQELFKLREGSIKREQMRMSHIEEVLCGLLEQAKATGSVREDLDSRLAATSICGAFVFSALTISTGEDAEQGFVGELMDIFGKGVGWSRSR